MKKKVLFITPVVHAAKSSGGLHVTLERLSSLANEAEVTVLTLSVDENAKGLYKNVEWVTGGSLRPKSLLNLLYSYYVGLPLSVWRNTNSEILKKAKSLSAKSFDIVYIDHWLMAEAGLTCIAKHKVLHLHNAEPEIFARAAVNASLPTRFVLNWESRRCATYLSRVMKFVDELHLLSEDDRKCLSKRNIHHKLTRVFMPAVNYEQPNTASFSERECSTLFIGTLSWHANQEGLHWYARDVLPMLPKDIKFDLIGGGASQSLLDEYNSYNNVKMHGYVNQVEPFYAKARCLVAPLLSGSGIKIKILHALARGLPIVTTKIGIEGFPSGYEKAILVSDNPVEFAENVKTLLNNQTLWYESSLAARQYCKQHFSGVEWQSWVQNLL
ncbi:glycosyltransferase [Patescibacteria group bacterium]|nr:MAG: glycosyltransferase [Patescibacteria group bacterium]